MSSRARFLVGILSLTIFNWLLAGAQNGAQNDYLDRVGIPDFTVADPVESGFINLANGGLHLEIPMAQLAQRGKTPFSIKLVYDSQVWGHSWPTVWYPNAMIGSMSGWRVIISGQEADGSICQGFVGGNCTGVNAGGYDSQCTVAPGPVIGNYTTITGFTFTDATGVSKTFSNFYIYSSPTPSLDCPPDTPNGEGPADDDSGHYIKVTNYNQAIVYDSNGNQVFPVEDTNGNIYGTNGNGIVDLNGRNPVIKSVSGNNIYYDVLNSEGGRSRYTLTTVTNNVHTAFGIVIMTEYAGTLTALQSLTLPNGRSYIFGYDSGTSPGHYGLLTSMTLPAGGQVQYGYSTFLDKLSNTTRWLTSRVSQGNQWTYAINGGGGIQEVTAQRPDGTSVVYTFSVISGINGAWPTSATFNDANGNIIETFSKEYITHGLTPSETESPSRLTTSLPTGISKKTEYSWSFPNVTEVREWNFYSGTAPATPTRITDATYTASNSTYSAKHILSKPTSIVVKNGSGTTVAFQANFEYDNYTAGISASGAVQHDPAFNTAYTTRGNLTAVQRWLSTDGSWLTTRNQYDDAGNMVSTTDPGLHTTTFSYADAWSNATCSPVSGNAAAYTTTVTNAKSQLQHSTYNSCTGTLASSTDVNGNTTNLSYADSSGNSDPLDRLIQTLMPPDANGDRAKKTTTYNESVLPLSATTVQSITTTTDLIETETLDNLGRPIQAAVSSDPQGTTYALTTYDSLGRKNQTFNPTRCNPPGANCGESTWGYVSYGYDVLNRPIIETYQDGGTKTYLYVGNSVVTTDQAGKQRRTVTDGLGRLIEVDEPQVGGVQANYHALMQQDGNFVLLNAAGNSVWSTGTGGTNAASIFMQDDGNLVAYIFKWQAGVYAAASPGPFPSSSCSIGTYLMAGQMLPSGKCIVSPHGQYFLLMNTDGNFFIYDWAHGTGTWGPGTQGHPGAYAIFQTDGNLVVYSASGVALWSSGTSGTYAERLDMNDDGRIIIWKSAWNSGTSNGQFNGTTYAHPSCDVGIGTGTTGLLWTGQCFVSPNGRFELLMQTDGNLVIYDRSVTPNAAIWSTGITVSPVDPSVAMRTLYTYDILDNLTCVEQHGDSATGTGCPATPPGPTDPPVAPDPNNAWRRRLFAYDSLSHLRWASNPESGIITYTYNADGELLQKTSPAPNAPIGSTNTQTVSYCYDALHRVTGRAYAMQSCPLTAPVVTYTYDVGTNAQGHLTSLTDQAGSASYGYDPLGRMITETRSLTGANGAPVSKTVSYDYNLNGSLYKLHYPSNAVVTYTPDSAGRTLSAVDNGSGINYITSATYGPDNAPTSFISGSGGPVAITNSFTYNKRLQPLAMSATFGSPVQTVFSIGYDFHIGNGTAGSGTDNGNVYGIFNYKDSTHGRDQTFTYDPLNRLLTAQNAGTDCTALVLQNKTEYWGNSYGYDAWGNLLQKTITKCGAEHLSVTADRHNWIHASGTDYQYDAAGNMTYDATAGLSYNFDQENRLTGAAGYTYAYDADGNRVRKSTGNLAANGTLYWYMSPGVVTETDLAGTTKSEYIFFNGERVARRDGATGTGGVFYYFSDHLKTASVITDSSGVIKAESDFYPWGGELQFINNDSNDYKFTGKKRDLETGLDYFGARYYSNGMGRWVSADWSTTPVTVPYANFADPQSLNLYGFVGGNPASKADPDGHAGGIPIPPTLLSETLKQRFHVTDCSAQATRCASAMRQVEQESQAARTQISHVWNHPVIQAYIAVAAFKMGGEAEGGAAEGAASGAGAVAFNAERAAANFGFQSFSKIGETFVGTFKNGASIAVNLGKFGSEMRASIPMMSKLSSETLRSIEKGAINAAKSEGSTSVTITARMTSEATGQILSKNGFTQIVDQAGHKTSEFIKTIPFENK